MAAKIRRVPFHVDKVEGVIAFALANPVRPLHPLHQLRRFLRNLISSTELVIDIQAGPNRVACAVLMDKLQNRSNSASLVIMGVDRSSSPVNVYELILREAKADLPVHRTGIEVDFCDDCAVDLKFFEDRGFTPFYTLYEMLKQDQNYTSAPLPEGFILRNMTIADLPDYHRVLSLVYADNLETSITPIEEMADALPKPIPHMLLLHHNQIVGFFSTSIDTQGDASGEIGSLGLLPSYRGQGLGRLLLNKAIEDLSLRNVSIKLTAAATNEAALGLYERAGFEILNQILCLRYARQRVV